MGHPILKHMNSFKASNDLKYNPVVDKASALRQNKGSMAYQKDMAPTMHGALHMDKGAPTLKKDEDFKGKKPMVKGPDGEMVPAYAVDGKGKS